MVGSDYSNSVGSSVQAYLDKVASLKGKVLPVRPSDFAQFESLVSSAEAAFDTWKDSGKTARSLVKLEDALKDCEKLRQWVMGHKDYSDVYSRIIDINLKRNKLQPKCPQNSARPYFQQPVPSFGKKRPENPLSPEEQDLEHGLFISRRNL